ncbi:hypothetical protein [Dysgonomonas termitidis]
MLTVTTTEKQVFLQVDNYRKIPFYKGQLRFRLSDGGDRFYVYLWPSEAPLINMSMSKGVTIDGQELTPENMDGLLEGIGAEQGGGGVTDHGELTGRDEADQHPIGAITGLQNSLDALTTMQGNWLGVDFATYAALTAYDAELSEKPVNKTWTFVNADENPAGGNGAQACYAWLIPEGGTEPELSFRYKILVPTTETDPVFTLWRIGGGLRAGANLVGTGIYGVGLGAQTNSNGNSSVAIGYSASAPSIYSVGIGRSAVASGDYSVAIGGESSATATNEFSVGNANRKRKITNVANGVANADAATVGQMNTKFLDYVKLASATTQKINSDLAIGKNKVLYGELNAGQVIPLIKYTENPDKIIHIGSTGAALVLNNGVTEGLDKHINVNGHDGSTLYSDKLAYLSDLDSINENIAGLATMQGNWLGQNFDTYADLEAYEVARLAADPPQPVADKTWTRVMNDENYSNNLTVYAWFNNAVTYQYTMVIDPRNFQTNKIQTFEIADSAVTTVKIANSAVTSEKINNGSVNDLKIGLRDLWPDQPLNDIVPSGPKLLTAILQELKSYSIGLFSLFTNGKANNAVQADKLAKAITISMTGDATGSASFDGSANISIPVNLNALGLVKNGVVRISGNGGDYASAVGIVNARRYFKLVDVSYTSAGWDGRIIFDVFYTQAGGGGGWGNGEAQGKVVLRPTWNANVFDIISTISGVDDHGIVILYNESAKVYSLYACASPGNYDSNRLYIDIRNLFAWAANNDNNNFMDSIFYASSGSYSSNTGLTQAQFDALPKTAVKWLWGG